GKGHRVEDDAGQGHHEEQEGQGKQNGAEDGATEMEQDEPGDDDDEGGTHQKILGAEIPDDKSGDSRDDDREPDQAPGSWEPFQRSALNPHDVQAEQGDEEPVRIVRVVPPLNGQRAKDLPVHRAKEYGEYQSGRDEGESGLAALPGYFVAFR